MIKLTRDRCIRGQGYAKGAEYEGPEEAYMVKNGWAEFVVQKAEAPADPVAEVGKEPIKKKATKKKTGRKKGGKK